MDNKSFINNIIKNSGKKDFKLGDFLVKHDYGINAYYKGKGGDVIIPSEFDDDVTLWFEKNKKITSLHYPGTFKIVQHPNDFASKDTVEKLIFDEGVTRITTGMGNVCFKGFKKLTEVQLPSTLKYLSKNAFVNSPWYEKNLEKIEGCYYLGNFLVGSDEEIEEAKIREGTIMICNGAFKDRNNLEKVSIPSTVETIDAMAFNGCGWLNKIEIPSNVKTIGRFAFTRCGHLTEIEISDNCSVDEQAFLDDDSPIPEKAYYPATVFEEAQEPSISDYYAMSYLTCKNRYTKEQQVSFDEYIRKRRSRILPQLIERDRAEALQAAVFALDKKLADGLIEKAQKHNAVSCTALLMNWKNENA